jgi:3-carboxy-cis,cis-muconate cycloisomerase
MTMASSRLIDTLRTTDALADVFSDVSVIQAMLDVEVALARAEARLGVIPRDAVDAIARGAVAAEFDVAALTRGARESGTLAVPLVAELTARVRASDAAAARFVHWGATSQDIVDTALVILVTRASALLAADHTQLSSALRALSDRHAGDVMLGRTLLQPAPPVTFGLKAAGWLAALSRCWRRLEHARAEACVLQFGGASGTLAALGDRGLGVAEALAIDLGLPNPEAPWHTHRDRLVAFVASCGIYTGALGKIARDLSLLMQAEVGEASEHGGTSSTLPHKKNPVGAATVLAAAARMPGVVSAALAGMVQEHERAVGAWHAELPIVADALQTTGAALAAMAGTVHGLSVDPERMRANIDRTNGAIFAERAMMRAGAAIGRERAHGLLAQAVARSRASGEPLGRAIRDTPEMAGVLTADDLRSLDDADSYLGMAESFRRRLLASADAD